MREYSILKDTEFIDEGQPKTTGFRVVRKTGEEKSLGLVANADSPGALAEDFKKEVKGPYDEKDFFNGSQDWHAGNRFARKNPSSNKLWEGPLNADELKQFHAALNIN